MRKRQLLPPCALLWVLLVCSGLLPQTSAQAEESADLVLLIDGSENVGAANFPRVRDIALKVIEKLNVDREAIRVAVALYGADPEIKFYLNSHESKGSVQTAIQGLTFPGGDEANLGTALEEVVESLLSPDSGGRADEGVPQILVVISAGQSSDDISLGEQALRESNVYTFGVAIGETARSTMEAVASDSSFVVNAPDLTAVDSMADQLLPYINGVAQRHIVLHTQITQAIQVGNRDIIFLIDSTMGATSLNAVREFIRKFVDSMPIGPDQVQVGVAQFTTTPSLLFDLNTYNSKESMGDALARIRPKVAPSVKIGAALDFVRTNMLRSEKGSRIQEGIPQLMLLLTSKKSSDSVEQAATALQHMGVLTMATGSKAADQAELQRIAFDPTLVFMLKDFRMLQRQPKQIVSPLSTLSGVVITESPTEPVVEITTVQTQKVVRDIIFLVDGSDYVGNANLPFIKTFINGIVNRLDVRPERARIGLMQYSDKPKTEFYLNSHNNKQDVLAAISQLRLMGGRTLNTGAALANALDNNFKPLRRPGVQQVLVLITGGPSEDEKTAKRMADKLAVEGILTFAVGADQADGTFLTNVAFVPQLAYYENRFDSLPDVVERIFTPLITVVGDTEAVAPPAPPPGGERDVAFLIDGTDAVRADFPYIRDFIRKVIEPLDIGTDKVRISVVQHSERPTPSFYLNTYNTKDQVMTAVSNMNLAGGRSLNTGAALKFMKDTILSASHGSRAAQNVPQFLIVLTGGRSRDNVRDPAGDLKTTGVVPFGVGVKDADPKQIEDISHNPSFAFKVKEFSELDAVQAKLNQIVNLPKEDLVVVLEQVRTSDVKRDVVFLLDGSDGTRDGFRDLVDFIQRVVETLNVNENNDRVSVVQYSGDQETNFYLNTYSNKDDVLNAIRSLKHKGGKKSNIGAALTFVRHSIFTASSGSRRLKRVPQILVLISSTSSDDGIEGPAEALKDLDIQSISVGVGNANEHELEMTALMPNLVHKISEFSFLPLIEPELVAQLSISKDTMEATGELPESIVISNDFKRDIIFLLDGSDDSRSGLPAMREFIRRMTEKLDIDEDNTRIAVVQYSDDALPHFLLNTYATKKEVIYAVRSLRPKGGKEINTGAALQYVRDHVLTLSSGSRRHIGVPQVLIVLTGGVSSDDIVGPAADLRRLKVLTFAIGMKNALESELQKIAYSSRFLFDLPSFGELLSIQTDILSFVQSKMEIEPPTIVGKKCIYFHTSLSLSPQIPLVSNETVSSFDGKRSVSSKCPLCCKAVHRMDS
ncbi:collagen alpha-3(VI) chain [Alosa alosa]|uniref:collagen alpha-3(VI) chain n=1 Tax=Alosa alosa TaxID=278164 RepID=UPI0020151717|nr:collagen alpha-3(VI) chain [Alosa alosa]